MKWVRYQLKDETFYGLLDNNIVTKIDGSPFSEYQTTDQNITLDRVKILAPVIPKTFYAAGINYKKHVSEAAALLNRSPNLPENADIGYRATNAITVSYTHLTLPTIYSV